MADEEYETLSDQDFSFDEANPRLTRVISPINKVTRMFREDVTLNVDEIADGLQSISMAEDSSDSEDDELKNCHNERIAVLKDGGENQPDQTTNAKKEMESKVAIVKPNNNKTNNEKMPIDKIKQKKTRAKKMKKAHVSDEEEFPSGDPSKSDKQTLHCPDLVGGSCSLFNQVKALSTPELDAFIKGVDDHQLLVKSDECFESDNDHAEAVVETKPTHVQTKKVTRGTAKPKMVKTEELEEDPANIEGNVQHNGKKSKRGKKATAVIAPNTSKPTDKEVITKIDVKSKTSRKVAKGKEGEPEKETNQVVPVELNKIKNKKPVEKVVPSSSNSTKIKRGKQPEGQINEESENCETSSNSKLNSKPSQNKRLANPNKSNDVKENKKTVKQIITNKIDTEENDSETNEQTVGDNIVISPLPLPAKRRQKNLGKEVNELKDKQPLKELNTDQEVKLGRKKRNVKNNTTNIPETKSDPKKRNIKHAPQVDSFEMESEENIDLPRPREVKSSAKENLNGNNKKNTAKPRKGANKLQEIAAPVDTAPEETASRRTTRNRK